MTLQGDLSTLDLADLLQNLELHRRTGLLTIEDEDRATLMYFKEGRLSLLATEDRPSLVEVLVASGAIRAEKLEDARRRRRRSRKSLGETLVAMGVITGEELVDLARNRLIGDLCEVIASGSGAFTFEQRPVPRGVFDPEERKLELEIPVGPTLLEAARRSDHWRRIRQKVTSDAAHYQVTQRSKVPDALGSDPLTTALLALLDGTRSVSEAMASFPHRRFEAFERLADLVDARAVRAMEAQDLAKLARERADEDVERAWEIVRRGLAVHSQHPDLLEVQAELAESRGEPESAVDGLKVLAHLRWESGALEEARQALEQALELDPHDPALWERSMDLALREERLEEAVESGLRLAELLRAPGLHKKARVVFERLLEADPDNWELVRERARSLVDCGDVDAAVDALEAHGARLVAAEDYEGARAAFEEVLSVDPARSEAADKLERIRTGAFERMVLARQRLARRVAVGAVAGIAMLWMALEGAARRAYVVAVEAVHRQELIEERRYDDAATMIEAVGRSHPFTSTALFDVPRHVAELRRKAVEGRRPPEPRKVPDPAAR